MKNELKRIRMTEFMMSAKQFAEKLEIEYTTYKGWESGASQPNLETALKVSQKLNRNIEDIWFL